MPTMRGTITVVQESRFQMTDEHGVSHLFTLGPNASAEPGQLAPLAARQAHVRIRYRKADDILAFVAEAIDLDEASAEQIG